MNEFNGRAAVVAEALTWLKTPYHHEARVKGSGVDCGTLLLEVYEAVGLTPHINVPHYAHDFHIHRDQEWYKNYVDAHATPTMEPKPGDITLYRFGRILSHGAIVIKWPQIIHAYLEAGAVVLDDAEANHGLLRRQAGFWTFWGDR